MTNSFRETLKNHEKIIGATGSVIAIIMYFSLIEVFISNIQGKSNIIIQPLATAINGSIWCLYAYSKKDWFLLAPNLLGLVLGAITVVSVFL